MPVVAADVKLGKNVKYFEYVNLYGCEIGDDTKIGNFVEIQKGVKVGKRCKISSHSFICEGVYIEDNVFIGHNVTFINDLYPKSVNEDDTMMTDGDWVTEDVIPTVPGGRPQDNWPLGGGPSRDERPVLNESAIDLLVQLGYADLGVSGSHKWPNSEGEPAIWQVPLDAHELQLAASLLAAAADKTGSITLDKVVYINSIFGINQAGSLDGAVEGKLYFDFGLFAYARGGIFGQRSSGTCNDGSVWVLQPEQGVADHYVAQCMGILGYDPDTNPDYNSVRFVDMEEAYTTVLDENGDPLAYNFDGNVRGFAQAADDALQVLEYIHNYKVPEVLYP